MVEATPEPRFAICVRNDECEDLERKKVYLVLPDEEAQNEGYLRVVDESGEDYLYPETYFAFVEIPRETREAITAPT
jgi:hypothetical protein